VAPLRKTVGWLFTGVLIGEINGLWRL
jgi:hypothetical protein